MEIGAQLYSVKDKTQNLEDFAETLKRVADMGYKTVQVSGTCAYEPEWLDGALKDAGLTCAVTHYDPAKIMADPLKVAEDHKKFGCKYIGVGYHSWREDGIEDRIGDFENRYKKAAQVFKDNGCYLMYHNHSDEFSKVNGRIIFEQLVERFAPEELGFIIDTYWIQFGGGDTAWWLRNLKGRVPCIHLKDMGIGWNAPKETWGQIMQPIGDGNMNIDEILKAAADSGCEHLLVEQDECNGEDPFACLKKSCDYLKSLGF